MYAHRHIANFLDVCSKYVTSIGMEDKTPQAFLRALRTYIYYRFPPSLYVHCQPNRSISIIAIVVSGPVPILNLYTCVYSVHSDNGSEFCAAVVKAFFEHQGITHVTSSAYHPQTQGQVERVNKTIAFGLIRALAQRYPDFRRST